MRQMIRPLVGIVIIFIGLLTAPAALHADTYTVKLDPAVRQEPATGRVMLFFITKTGMRWDRAEPKEAPFFGDPQPIASIDVKDFKPGDSITLDGSALASPESLDKLNGKMRVQAVLDTDQTERSFLEGPGNVYSDVMSIEVSAAKDDAITIALTHRIDPPAPRPDLDNLKWISFRSELLSKFYGRDVYHRAGVALPKNYNDPKCPRQQWPAIYVIPGYGGRIEEAKQYVAKLAADGIEKVAPVAVYVVLDPESPLGHHGFVDSPNNGPRETALLTEFIPYLESKFRLVAKPEARLVTGHSSGGWSSLWLQMRHPEIFGQCWSSSPDPIDFTAFQMTDLYSDQNMFADSNGKVSPSFRAAGGPNGESVILMTVRQEKGMEHAIDPTGRSGQQWDAWDAMFSPKDETTGLPMPMFDPITGAINKHIVRNWSKFDIANIVRRDWPHYAPIVVKKVHLACGDQDSYYLNRAVQLFKQMMEEHSPEFKASSQEGAGGGAGAANGGSGGGTSSGYILMVPKANHDTITPLIMQRWNKEMRQYLQSQGLQDPDLKAPQ